MISHNEDITFQFILHCFHETTYQIAHLWSITGATLKYLMFKMSPILQKIITLLTQNYETMSDWLVVSHGYHFEVWCSKWCPFYKDILHCLHETVKQYIILTYGQSRVPLWSMIFKMMSILERYITLLTRNSETIYHSDFWSIMGATLKCAVQNVAHFAKILHCFQETMNEYIRLLVCHLEGHCGCHWRCHREVVQVWMPESRAIEDARFECHWGGDPVNEDIRRCRCLWA